jgi:hypothetical protein
MTRIVISSFRPMNTIILIFSMTAFDIINFRHYDFRNCPFLMSYSSYFYVVTLSFPLFYLS